MLTVLTWLWAQPGGKTTYTAAHVNVWADMVRRNLSRPHDLACVTDMPAGIDRRVRIIRPPGDFEAVTIPSWRHGRPSCFRRIAMFRPDAAALFGGDVLVQLDLDVVVVAPIDPLFAGGEAFRIARGTAGRRTCNGSLWMLKAGSHPQVFTTFTPERAAAAGRRHVGSDQSWLAAMLPKAPTWGLEDGVAAWHQRAYATKTLRLLTYPGEVKPDRIAAAGRDALVVRHYRRDTVGRALLLGYGPTLWRDVEAVLETGARFDAVIASPEAARHWPGEVAAVAWDDAHAERIAAMQGYVPVWCGKSGGANAVAA